MEHVIYRVEGRNEFGGWRLVGYLANGKKSGSEINVQTVAQAWDAYIELNGVRSILVTNAQKAVRQ